MTPEIRDNKGTLLGEKYISSLEIANFFLEILKKSKEKDVIEWMEGDRKMAVSHNSEGAWFTLFPNEYEKTHEDAVESLADGRISFKVPWDGFTASLVSFWGSNSAPFYEELCDAGDGIYGEDKWTLDYYLITPTKEQLEGKYREEYGDNIASIAFFARGHDGKDNES
jgi:hypothetical protein